jgi:FHA domain-containing protein/zinc ribbon family protein
MRVELETYLTGTLAGAGSFRCRECGFAVALNALDEVPKCPNCGNAHFARSSMFDISSQADAPDDGDDMEWLSAVREDLEEGHFLAYREEGRVSVMPLMSEWTRIGRALTADVRFDDPTVSRRHAIIVRQDGGARVMDDRSLNGVFLNGDRVEWEELDDGDEVIIGRHRLYFLDTVTEGAASGSRKAQHAA